MGVVLAPPHLPRLPQGEGVSEKERVPYAGRMFRRPVPPVHGLPVHGRRA